MDVHLPDGMVRQYSLRNDAHDTSHYRLGVGRSVKSRGGSAWLHEMLRSGDTLRISEPRVLFGLAPEAPRHRFVAGGIGITPILSMIQWCHRHKLQWQLSYCVRSRAHAAYLDVLGAMGGDVRLYIDDEVASPHDIGGMLAGMDPAEHIYCCGPGGLMDAVGSHAVERGISPDRVHFERFAAPAVDRVNAADAAFTVVLAKSGASCKVAASESILEALERNGFNLPFSCREGLCRTCEVGIVSGEAEHRDYVLSDEERREGRSLIACVSRAATEEIVIDL
ncbi:2Fe-2S iron-sulfur cluster-binding protein [Paraburkholderia sp. EG287A]|uniref:PDR/VanB family oxidoreductase n=1 Tax=Paraburkholderia sp. EG287A TaxID=3237012 RepID=UPI0034D34ED4